MAHAGMALSLAPDTTRVSVAGAIDREDVVAASREETTEQDIDARVGSTARLEHDRRAGGVAAVQIDVDAQALVLEPYVLDPIQHPLDRGRTSRVCGQAWAAKHHVTHRDGEALRQAVRRIEAAARVSPVGKRHG